MHVTAKTSQGMGSPNRISYISYGRFLRLGVPQYLDGLFHGKPHLYGIPGDRGMTIPQISHVFTFFDAA